MDSVRYYFLLSFSVLNQTGLAIVVAENEIKAFQCLKNAGAYNASVPGYMLINIKNVGKITQPGVYGLLLESFVNAMVAFDAMASIAEKIIGPQGPPGKDAEVTYENVLSALGYTPADARLVSPDASQSNPLIDKAYVDSHLDEHGVTYRGTFNLVTDLELTAAATRGQIIEALTPRTIGADTNDFAFVQIPNTNDKPEEIYSVERYKYHDSGWGYEYTLSPSGFNSTQWAAINSGINPALVSKLSALPTNAELVEALNRKVSIDESQILNEKLIFTTN